MKIDMHVHSRYSGEPSVYLLKKLGTAECYTDPFALYRLARQRGMDAVTMTDHNTIDGCLRIAHLPGAFTGCEVTATFPEDQCLLHVLAYQISEEQFAEIDRLRENVYDLVNYLNRLRIKYALAHPYYAVNNRITPEHLEKCLLLFRCFEFNGEQPALHQRRLREVLASLTPETIERLINKHDILPSYSEPWNKCIIGGSDDHSSLYLANTFTEVPGANRMEDFWRGVESGEANVYCHTPATPLTRSHHLYSVAYQYYKQKFQLDQRRKKTPVIRFLDKILHREDSRAPNALHRLGHHYNAWKIRRAHHRNPNDLLALIQKQALDLIENDPEFRAAMIADELNPHESHRLWVRFFNHNTQTLLHRLLHTCLDNPLGGDIFRLFHSLGATGGVYSLMGPFLASFANVGKERALSQAVHEQLGIGAIEGSHGRDAQSGTGILPVDHGQDAHATDHGQDARATGTPRARVAIFTDTLDEVNGVAQTLRKQATLAHKTGKNLTLISCGEKGKTAHNEPNIKYFEPIFVHELPEYPQQKLTFPPLLELLSYCCEQGFTCIQSPTPGPMGLIGLIVARLMKIPFTSTYHTHIPQYARYLTNDTMAEDIAWTYVLWFYRQAGITFAPSRETAESLIARGLPAESIRLMPRGVDTERFHPEKRELAPALPGGFKFLYVGRISREKNLPLLADAFKKLCGECSNVQLIVVGDGPYLKEMKKDMAGTPAYFTGVITGDELAGVYAACDGFVFPSTTDTFGNVILEAQASGIPVIVTDMGGPCENLVPGQTGLVIKGEDQNELHQAMKRFVDEPGKCRAMGANARKYAENRSIEKAFEQYWQHYEPFRMAPAPLSGQPNRSVAIVPDSHKAIR